MVQKERKNWETRYHLQNDNIFNKNNGYSFRNYAQYSDRWEQSITDEIHNLLRSAGQKPDLNDIFDATLVINHVRRWHDGTYSCSLLPLEDHQ